MKRIYCSGCNKYLGTIRDATLYKGIKYLCPECETKRVASDIYNETQNKNPFESLFDGFRK